MEILSFFLFFLSPAPLGNCVFDFGENKRQPVTLSNKGWNAGLTNWNNILEPRRPVLKMFGTCLVENILCCVFVMYPSVMFITT